MLFAVNCSPNIQPDEELPATMASHMASVFQQMVFDEINYEMIASKGSLTNCKLILAFVPGYSLDEFDSLTNRQKLSIADRQQDKVIFSPAPNAINLLKARWAFKTSIANTDEHMGIVVFMVYQKIVANIADGGTNEIRLTCRMSTKNLHLRYPLPPGLGFVDDSYLKVQRELYQPQNSENIIRTEQEYYPRASINNVETPTMVGLPRDIMRALPRDRLINAMTKDGVVSEWRSGINDIFGLDRRNFVVYNTSMAAKPKGSHLIQFTNYTTTPFEAGYQQAECDVLIKFPFKKPENMVIGRSSTVPRSTPYCVVGSWKNACRGQLGGVATGCEVVYDDSAQEVSITGRWTTLGKDSGDYDTANLINTPWDETPVRIFYNEAHWTGRIDTQVNPMDPPVDEGHGVFWTEYPETVSADEVVEDIVSNVGLPLIGNLENQNGASNDERNPNNFQAQMVVGDGTSRGVLESVGNVLHTVESFMPMLDIFGLRAQQAVVVSSSPRNPITYVPTETTPKLLPPRMSLIKTISRQRMRELRRVQQNANVSYQEDW